MIKNKFLKVGLYAALAASFSATANAGLYEKYQNVSLEETMQACPNEQFRQAITGKESGVRTADFTNQPEACVARFAKSISNKYQVIVAERQEEPWRTETLNAATEIQTQTQKPVIVAYYKDVDPDDKMARTSFWSWGHQQAAYQAGDEYGIFSTLLAKLGAKDDMVRHGVAVQAYKDETDRNLRVSTVAPTVPSTVVRKVSEPLVAAR